MPKSFRRVIGYGLIALGIMAVIYGFSEYMYALKSVQVVLGKIIKMKPQLFNDPVYQAIINISIGQATAMKVLTYIVPGFIISGIGFILIFLDDVIKRLDGFAEAGTAVLKSLDDAFSPLGQEETIDLTEGMESKEQ
jgi:hypothetical protein